MSYTYTVKGKRFLRKYTAAAASPVYAAAIDAQKVADTLCDVPWERVAATSAGFTAHTDEALDENVAGRDGFDAALFCAGHSNGKHTVYANAACYLLTLPDSAVGVTLESLSVKAASDPYNAAGLRIAILTNSTGEIPTDCATCRNGDAHVEGAVPRTTRTVGTTTYWDAASDTVTISPTGGLTLQKYLIVFVVLENYATSRGNWLEGSGYIQNAIALTTAAEVTGWNDVAEGNALRVVKDGLLPLLAAGSVSGVRRAEVQLDGTDLLTDSGDYIPAGSATAAQSVVGLHALYRKFLSGGGIIARSDAGEAQVGARFAVRSTTRTLPGKLSAKSASVWELESALLVVPFVMPDAFRPSAIRLDFAALSLHDGTAFNVFLAPRFVSPDEKLFAAASLYDAREEVEGWRMIGKVTGGTTARFDLTESEAHAREATIVISAYVALDKIDVSATGWQGVENGFKPDITII